MSRAATKSRRRRHSRCNNSITGTANEDLDGQDQSSESDDSDHRDRTRILLKERVSSSESTTKSSRRRSKRMTDKSKEEIDPQNSVSSQYESETHIKNSDSDTVSRRVKKTSVRLAKTGKRRKSTKEHIVRSQDLDFNKTDEHEIVDNYSQSSLKHVPHSPSQKDSRISLHKSRKKRQRSRGDIKDKIKNQDEEIPITDILRKAQENTRNCYKDPVPLAELTTDTIYIQGRKGFSAVKISNDKPHRVFNTGHSQTLEPKYYPIKLAILAQKLWGSSGLIHQGLLAGMALMHFLLIQKFFKLSLNFLADYSLISEHYTNIFSFLVIMCIISVFDKFDLAHLNLEHSREIYIKHARSFLAIPLYITTFCLHQSTLLIDDKISLLSYAANITDFENNSTIVIADEDLGTWQKVTLAKDGLAILAWIFVALGPREDMFLMHLKAMDTYTNVAVLSR